jgi:ferrous iron transport protein A
MKTQLDTSNTHHQHHSPAHQRLVDAAHGIWHKIASISGPDEARDRLLDLGFTPGAEVRIVQSTPLGDPLVVVLRGARLALRKQEAAWITVL